MRALAIGKRLFANSKLPIWAAMAVGGAVVGVIAIGLPQVFGNGFEATDRILHGNPTLLFLLALCVGKTVATAATIGSGGVGGVFTPSLLVGATVGGIVAKLVHAALPHLSAPVGGYALLGMGGMMAGVTRAPLLAVIMIFELTQNTAVLLPMMVVSVVAVAAAKLLQKDSMYVASLRSAGIVWESTPEATALASLKVSDIMRRDVVARPADDAAAGDRLPLPVAPGASFSTSATRRGGCSASSTSTTSRSPSPSASSRTSSSPRTSSPRSRSRRPTSR